MAVVQQMPLPASLSMQCALDFNNSPLEFNGSSPLKIASYPFSHQEIIPYYSI